ncbi:MAG: YifB family Mg chelatase-like AAA ATPase [Eubacterium sp.]|nr:YifB family Mg chelatase-like AAA ATPase [Eubacterium sp.]
MYSCINSGSPLGIDGMLVSVEADISLGLPSLSMVGYLASSVREAGDRVRTALKNSGYGLPPRRITVSLSPADVRKDGAGFDLAIAVALLCSMEILSPKGWNDTIFLGELGLDGSVRGVPGVLAVAHFAAKHGYRRFVVPECNAAEAACIEGLQVYGVKDLKEVIGFLEGTVKIAPTQTRCDKGARRQPACDISEIHGQRMMKRGMEIAVAGFHNIILTGAAGAGKSLMAKCLPGLMPDMTYEERLELTKIYSVAGLLKDNGGLMDTRPFRSPHANVSAAALLGGGSVPKPGEVSLADCGVLFLDEFPEFGRGVIESLRAPMEDQEVTVSRVKASYRFPARFMLVAARNHCPCGYYPDRSRCRCRERQIVEYRNRISHPIMDRIDIRIEVRPVRMEDLLSGEAEETSRVVRGRIEAARARQLERYRDEAFRFNSAVPQKKLQEYISLGPGETEMLRKVYEKGELSARGYFKVLRLARTIADLAGHDDISSEDLSEALFFRSAGDEEGGETYE